MKKLRFLKDALLGITTVLCLFGATFAVFEKASFLTVTSRSMEPTFMAGDTVITKKISTDAVNENDILVLPVPQNPQLRYAHRVFQVSQVLGEIIIKTKGDANPQPDAWTLKITSSEIPKEIAVIPTSKIFKGPISRRSILYALLLSGMALAFIGIFRLIKNRQI